ncbi:MAG: response regulator [Cyanobacteria bacterium RM1_2_2]|nr:response regulator [Cyanobacteria bacterium RM1_2_2]
MSLSETFKKTGDILLIDDTPDNLRFLSELLGKAGYTVRKVINGELGLEAAQLEPPDLILLDVKMPGLNGYSVCDRLKVSERTANIPVIFLSAMDEELDKVMAFEAGGVDYITKPFQLVEVLARIETHLQVSRLRQQLQQQNAQLQQEIAQRAAAESALERLNHELEIRIRERTLELEATNQLLLGLQTELQQALLQEQRLNQFKSQIFSALSAKLHEPLTNILAATELHHHKWDNQEPNRLKPEHQSIRSIAENAQLLQQVIHQSLHSVNTPISLPEFSPQFINLSQLCQRFVETWQLPESPLYQLSFISWGKCPGLLWVDGILLQQAFFQLLSNAVQYSPTGGTILFQLVYESTQAIIQVRDEGIGIPVEELNRVFDCFYCASNSAQVNTTGFGLGLTLAKQAIEVHQGTIEIDSALGKGTTVTLKLPLVTKDLRGQV